MRNAAPNPDLTCRVYKLLPLLIILDLNDRDGSANTCGCLSSICFIRVFCRDMRYLILDASIVPAAKSISFYEAGALPFPATPPP